MFIRRYQLIAATLLLAACTPAEDRSDTTARLQATPGDTVAARTVHVMLEEWSVAPAETELAAGRVAFHVMNHGQYHHALEVERGNDEWETEHITPGGNATLTVDLTPGTYTLYCPIDDQHGSHAGRGMRTQITVR